MPSWQRAPSPGRSLRSKVARMADDIAPLEVFGPDRGDLLILGWGSTYGAIRSAVERLDAEGRSVAHAHLRHLNPFPANTEKVLRSYRRVLIPEMRSEEHTSELQSPCNLVCRLLLEK